MLPGLPGRPGEATCSKRNPRGAPNGAPGATRKGPRSRRTAQERPKSPRRQQEALNKPKEAPRASPGQTACTTAAGRENERAQRARENERAQRARDGLTRDPGNARDLPRDHHTTIPRETYLYRDTTRPRKTREIYHETTRPRTPRQMYLFRRSTGPRKTRELYRWATRQTRQPRRPTVAPTAFPDSAFRLLSSQVLGRAGGPWGLILGLFRAPRGKPRNPRNPRKTRVF